MQISLIDAVQKNNIEASKQASCRCIFLFLIVFFVPATHTVNSTRAETCIYIYIYIYIYKHAYYITTKATQTITSQKELIPLPVLPSPFTATRICIHTQGVRKFLAADGNPNKERCKFKNVSLLMTSIGSGHGSGYGLPTLARPRALAR